MFTPKFEVEKSDFLVSEDSDFLALLGPALAVEFVVFLFELVLEK